MPNLNHAPQWSHLYAKSKLSSGRFQTNSSKISGGKWEACVWLNLLRLKPLFPFNGNLILTRIMHSSSWQNNNCPGWIQKHFLRASGSVLSAGTHDSLRTFIWPLDLSNCISLPLAQPIRNSQSKVIAGVTIPVGHMLISVHPRSLVCRFSLMSQTWT